MAGESLIIGDGNWGVKSDSLLGYAVNSGRFVPRDLTFTRATTGTRTNGALLVETTPYNLLTYSEQFGTGTWATDSTSVIVPNAVTAPNGTLTADRLVPTTANAQHYLYQMTNYSGNNTVTIYAKANGYNYIALGTGVNSNVVFFNLSNGTIGTVRGAVASYSIESVGDGWYRCSVGLTVYTGSFSYSILVTAADNVLTFAGDGTSGVYLWGAQNVYGPSALTYLPTTTRLNIPRVDYSTGTAALLLEPQRTNIALQSESMASPWYSFNLTLTANATISPSGLNNAAKLTILTANGYIQQDISTVVSTVYTFSVYVKSATGSNVNGAIHAVNSANAQAFTATNTWQRVSVTATATATLSSFFIGGYNTLSLGEDIFIWGAQVEVGSYPTSYIPTTSASVTRNADNCSRTGISSLIGQTEGTIVLDINTIAENSDWITINPISGSPYTNGIGLGYYSNSVRFSLNSPSGSLSTVLASFAGRNKIAIAYKSGDTNIYINGVSVFSSAGAFSFGVALDGITVASSSWQVGFVANNKLYSHKLYKTRLSNAELATLTK